MANKLKKIKNKKYLTTLEGAENGKVILREVKYKFLILYSCRSTPEQGPSMRTLFWSVTSTMAAILPLWGPSWSRAIRPISTDRLNGIFETGVRKANLIFLLAQISSQKKPKSKSSEFKMKISCT